MKSSSRRDDVWTLCSMLVNPHPPSFLDSYELPRSSLGCKALCVLITFLLLYLSLFSLFLNFHSVVPRDGKVHYSASSLFIWLIWVFFTPVLADSFPLESDWQQVFSGLQDSSQYSGQSQQCCSLDGLHMSPYFQVLQTFYRSFNNYTKRPDYNWNKCPFNYYYFTHLRGFSFTATLTDGFLLLSEWQQASSVLQDSS